MANLTPREAKRQAEIKLKAAVAAEKARRKASKNPSDMGRLRQIQQVYQLTAEHDKALPWLLLLAGLGPLVLFLGIALILRATVWDSFFPLLYGGILGIFAGLIAAMLLLANRAKRASFKRYAGQAGSAEIALNLLGKKWTTSPAIVATRQLDTVHRTIGPGGVILIGEGESARVKSLLASEEKKHLRVSENLPVITLIMGSRSNEVPLEQLTEHIRKLPKVMQPHEIASAKARLTALDAVRPRIPVPRGPVPTNPKQMKGARQAMRGR